MFKTTLATLVLVCCAAGLTTSATALAPCDGVKQCKIAQCQAARAAKVAQVTSDKRAQCAAAKAARAANVAQVKSSSAPACCTAAKAARAANVAQVKSSAVPACCTAAKAARAANVAQVKSSAAPACCTAAKAAKNANADAAQVKYVAFGCRKTDALVREAAEAYLKAVAQLQKSSGASGCALGAASKTLAAVINEMMAEQQTATVSATTADTPVVTTVSLGSVSGCGPDCTKACCANAKPGN